MTKNKEGNYLISSGSIVKTLSNEDQEEEQEEKVVIYPATQLYISGMTVVGLFILYRLMMRYSNYNTFYYLYYNFDLSTISLVNLKGN